MHVAAKYAKERKQFGQPIANFGLMREKLARMAALMFGAESALYRTSGLLDDAFDRRDPNGDAIDENRKACEEFQIECSLTKVLTTEVLSAIVDEALQIHGGYGFTEEFAIARLYRDARVMRIYEGTNEINRVFAFDRIVKRGVIQKLIDAAPTCPAHSYLIQAARAIDTSSPMPQELTACMSDLLILTYAQQSANRRAEAMRQNNDANASFGSLAASSFEGITTAWAASRCSEALARAGASSSVSLSPSTCDSTLADALLEKDGYPI